MEFASVSSNPSALSLLTNRIQEEGISSSAPIAAWKAVNNLPSDPGLLASCLSEITPRFVLGSSLDTFMIPSSLSVSLSTGHLDFESWQTLHAFSAVQEVVAYFVSQPTYR